MSSYLVPPRKQSRLIAEALIARNENQQWEEFIVGMLKKLELPEEKRRAAEARYREFGQHVATTFGIGLDDVHVVVQGSMRTQTTVAGDSRRKFDLDVVVKITGPGFEHLEHSEGFFQKFGRALDGVRDAGKPEAKSRCWRLNYPGEPFYFDVTPAIPTNPEIEGTHLRVRDPDKVWSPSNPEEFADWFCNIAAKRFTSQTQRLVLVADARTLVDPIPNEKVGLDDVLRRLVQLMKLHRDSYYQSQPDVRREAAPISVILVTLAAKAYDQMVTKEPAAFSSPIEIALEIVARMPSFVEYSGRVYSVNNPALPGAAKENFADRWNRDDGLRAREFDTWHDRLTKDLEALFSEEYSKRSENRVRSIFGDQGVQVWKASQGSGALAGLLTSGQSLQPAAPRKSASSDTFA